MMLTLGNRQHCKLKLSTDTSNPAVYNLYCTHDTAMEELYTSSEGKHTSIYRDRIQNGTGTVPTVEHGAKTEPAA